MKRTSLPKGAGTLFVACASLACAASGVPRVSASEVRIRAGSEEAPARSATAFHAELTDPGESILSGRVKVLLKDEELQYEVLLENPSGVSIADSWLGMADGSVVAQLFTGSGRDPYLHFRGTISVPASIRPLQLAEEIRARPSNFHLKVRLASGRVLGAPLALGR